MADQISTRSRTSLKVYLGVGVGLIVGFIALMFYLFTGPK